MNTIVLIGGPYDMQKIEIDGSPYILEVRLPSYVEQANHFGIATNEKPKGVIYIHQSTTQNGVLIYEMVGL